MATVVTNSGLAIATSMFTGSGTEPAYVAWGTGTTAAAVTDTALETESAESRVSGTTTQQTDTVTDDTWQVVGTISSSSTQAITEMGLLDASTAGNLFLHSVFSAINVDSGDGIEFTVQTVFS